MFKATHTFGGIMPASITATVATIINTIPIHFIYEYYIR